MNGSIAWQASPSSVTRPADQRASGGRSNSAQMNVSSTAPDDRADLRVPALEGGERVGDLAAVGPRFARPRVLLDDGDEVDQPPAADEVVHEVPAGAHPHLRGDLEPELAQPLGRHQPAVGDAAGEARLLGPEQEPAHRRVDPVRADQHVELGARAVGEARLDAVAVVGEAGEPVAEVDALGGQRARPARRSRSARCIW